MFLLHLKSGSLNQEKALVKKSKKILLNTAVERTVCVFEHQIYIKTTENCWFTYNQQI